MRRLLLAIALTAVLAGNPAPAAEISCLEYGDPSKTDRAHAPSKSATSNAAPLFDKDEGWEPVPCVEGLLRGQIVGGDYENVVRLFRDSHPLLRRFNLISPGGSVEEAIRIGRLFRKYTIEAAAPIRLEDGRFVAISLSNPEHPLCDGSSDCICASACAPIWFGAVDRLGTVGLHRPRIDDLAFRSLNPTDASAAYRQMLDGVRGYLDEMEVPKQMIESMVATGSAEIRWVDAIEDKLERPPSIAEWEDASCGTFTGQENNTMLHLRVRRLAQPLSQEESLFLNLLLEKLQKKVQCEGALISSHRERLAPP